MEQIVNKFYATYDLVNQTSISRYGDPFPRELTIKIVLGLMELDNLGENGAFPNDGLANKVSDDSDSPGNMLSPGEPVFSITQGVADIVRQAQAKVKQE